MFSFESNVKFLM